MNEQEKEYFDAVYKDRLGDADQLEKPSFKGVKDSVVKKYSDQAHFIYELLQNADDAKAETVRFILEKDRLIFAHDGKRHFSVTDPKNEAQDIENKSLGDINAIASIGNSNKTEASIGKFGLGFKAVFQYTSTPHIYDPKFKFRIERFIVPILLDNDFSDRRDDETLFVFPFDHPERDAVKAYREISEKLRKLTYPLLFLSNLKNIKFQIENVSGLYDKCVKETRTFGDTKADYLLLTQIDGNTRYTERLWLFSRKYDRGDDYGEDERYLTYSVGFFVDEKGHLISVVKPAFCYFSTKENTNLKFIINAPFLLTDSREGIRAGEPHNDDMIRVLAELAADSIEYLRDIGNDKNIRLIDDDIISIIPVTEDNFTNPSDKNQVSFLPFFQSIKKKFQESEILPAKDSYVGVNNAYWASVPKLAQLFDNEQLGEIVKNPDACWVFVTRGRDELLRNNKILFDYINNLTRTSINEDNLLNSISAEFIEHQPIEWLHKFYGWIFETKHRCDIASKKPIFIDQDGKSVAAFDESDQPVLYLPAENVTGYRVINQELLKNEETKAFFEQIGIKQPSLKDRIYKKILPKYSKGCFIDNSDLLLFLDYYCNCAQKELSDFITSISDKIFWKYFVTDELNDELVYRFTASSMYLSTPELRNYFETKPDALFIDLDKYREVVGDFNEKHLIDFLIKLGIRTEVEICNIGISAHQAYIDGLPRPVKYTQILSYNENIIDGCSEIIDYIVSDNDANKSVILWNCLLKIIKTKCNSFDCKSLDNLLINKCKYFYYSEKSENYPSSDALALKNKAWIMNSDGKFVTASEVSVKTLSKIYDTESAAAKELLDFLGIVDEFDEVVEVEEDNSNLTDEQRKKIDFVNLAKEYGIETEDDLKEFKEFKLQKEALKKAKEKSSSEGHQENRSDQDDKTDVSNDHFDDAADGEIEDNFDKTPVNKATKNVLKDIARRTKDRSSVAERKQYFEEEDADEDEYLPTTVDYSKKIERAKEKSAVEIEKIAYYAELQNKALESEKYSYGWFSALLEMESISSGEFNANSKEVSISFARVEREPGTKRTLVLKHPNRYIPQFMEDLADIPMVLHIGDKTKTVAIEVANIKSYTLRVKMKNASDIEGIDLSAVTSVTIDAKSPAFLLEELRKKFAELGYDDDFNMQSNLCENIEFVFGPPGTGKTTYLANNVLIPMMKENRECKVLVLAPTNKSADVLVRRIMEESGDDQTYKEWLVRFGATGDEEIERSSVYKDKTFDIRTLEKNVTVTTIARFPYDFFMPHGARIFLHAVNWDYIVIDEASMIPIANIVFPLYKKTPKKFIIAGDPFQIEPITSVDLWKNENIYTLVQLDSFVDPATVPHQYGVELLTTQYRSVPDIGGIFSNFAYGGILEHYRSAGSRRSLNLGAELGIETLNIIKFPVSKYESIYRSKRLQHSSSYQVYSALFTFEYVCYLSKMIAEKNPGKEFKIGVIAPYRAQADLIEKLLASESLPKETDVQVGTIHGFQGDECDIIFAVFNTPPSISSSKEMFLNKKNIINVSISRARDYLFVVMPDDNTENISNLSLIKRVEGLIHDTDAWAEFKSSDLEVLMFGDSKYLESNAFSTSHQSVNVYSLPEKRYEFRTEDAAVDVQILKPAKNIEPAQTYEDAIDEDNVKHAESMDSHVPDDINIPEKLQTKGIVIQVKGDIFGQCSLIPYEGKLKKHTSKKAVSMNIPLMRNGAKKMVSVAFIEEDRAIYIPKNVFELYEQALSGQDVIELNRTSFE